MKAFLGVTRFYSGKELTAHFLALAETASAIDIATAWLSRSNALDLLVSQGARVKIRIVVGVSGYSTEPAALKLLSDKTNVDLRIFERYHAPLFLPKLYGFRAPLRCRVLIGSMNFTSAGTSQNIESVLSLDMKSEDAGSEFERFWKHPKTVGIGEFDLDSYAALRRSKLAAVKEISGSDVLDPEVAAMPNSPAEADVLQADWNVFVSKVKAVRDIDQWQIVLDDRHLLVDRNWSKDLDQTDLKLMFGSRPYQHFGDTGALKMAMGHFLGEDGRGNRLLIGAAMDRVKGPQPLSRSLMREVVDELLSIRFCGPALATRLLVLARPDVFVIVNAKSFRGLMDLFDVKLSVKRFDAPSYMNFLDVVHGRDWYKSPEPSDRADREIWQARAAYIDPLVYDEQADEDG